MTLEIYKTVRGGWTVAATIFMLLLATASLKADSPYDPLAIASPENASTLDLTVHDQARDRDIPAFVYLPASTQPAPVVLFSHGLGGSRTMYAYLGPHWAARGYVAVFMQHQGSDDAVWKDKPPIEGFDAMRRAVNVENFMLRAADVSAVLDQLQLWNDESGHALEGRLDLKHVGMSGHSFGAVTTQAVSGERFPVGGDSHEDKHITAAIMMSPSGARLGGNDRALGEVSIPWMLMTGTKDTAPIGDMTVESRLAVFPALPPGSKYEVVLADAEHSAFSDRALPGDREPRNPNHHRAVLALSTAFWDACLRDDPAARQWLDGDGPRKVLAAEDRWERK